MLLSISVVCFSLLLSHMPLYEHITMSVHLLMNTCVVLSFGVKWPDPMVSVCLISKESTILFSKGFSHFTLPSARYESSSCFPFLPTFIIHTIVIIQFVSILVVL